MQGNESNKPAAVEVSNLSKSFGATAVLRDINFAVEEGEIVVLLGASGSGKTTILRIISGLETQDEGTVSFDGRDVSELPARLRSTGVIFQSYALFPKMSVEKNIGYGLRLRGRAKSDIRDRVDELVKLVHLEEHRKKRPSQLSGGQQQRVAIARALAYEPEVLLFDEPFGALDAQIRTRLRREIRTLLKEIKVPSIFITHDQEEALELGDRIAVLNAGQIEQIGTPFEVYMYPQTEFVATFLGAANILAGTFENGSFRSGEIAIDLGDTELRLREGQSIKLVFRPEDVFLRKPENLKQSYQNLAEAVVEEVSFVGAFERLQIRLETEEAQHLIVTRPKTETSMNPLAEGDRVSTGVVRFRILPNSPLGSEMFAKSV
ncbi:MAG: ABC transporter ATP-binding protein [Pyrinomonadaceae bacterium]